MMHAAPDAAVRRRPQRKANGAVPLLTAATAGTATSGGGGRAAATALLSRGRFGLAAGSTAGAVFPVVPALVAAGAAASSAFNWALSGPARHAGLLRSRLADAVAGCDGVCHASVGGRGEQNGAGRAAVG